MNEQQNQKIEYITTIPIRPLVIKLAIPTIISQLVTSFYNMADTFFVGKLNTSAVAAVGLVFSVMSIIQACGFFFGHGSGNFVSRELGKKRIEDASKMASTGFFCALICGFIIMALGLIFLTPLSILLGSTKTMLPYTKEYLSIILLGAPYMTASLVLNNQLRFQGSTQYAMIGLVSGAIINIGLDPLFIFVFDMGVAGAAWATILSQFVSFLLLLMGSMRGGNIKIRFRNFTPSWFYAKEIVRGGTPSLCRQGLGSLSTIILNTCAAGYGDAAVAAMSIATRIMYFALSVVLGIGQGFQPVCGFNYGAQKFTRVREAFYYTVKITTVLAAVFSVAGLLFAPYVIPLFRDDPEVVQYGVVIFRLQAATFWTVAWVTISNMMLQTIGSTAAASFLAVSRNFVFFIPTILVLPIFVDFWGIMLAQPIADVFSFAVALIIQLRALKKMQDAVDHGLAE